MTQDNDVAIPRIKDIYEVIPSTEGLSHIRSGDEIVLKVAGEKGPLLGQLLLTIDGRKNTEQIVNEFQKTTERVANAHQISYLSFFSIDSCCILGMYHIFYSPGPGTPGTQ